MNRLAQGFVRYARRLVVACAILAPLHTFAAADLRPSIAASSAAATPVAVATQGDVFSVDHYTIDSGGGTSTGGVFSVSGTIGQPDADPLQPSTGGVFAVTGGFWPSGTTAILPEAIFANGFEP